MTQADMALQAIQGLPGNLAAEIRIITTCGDRDRCTPLEEMGGFGVFTKELDHRLLSGEIDLAVNSLKDMPSGLTPGTRLLAVLPRGPVNDVLVSKVPLERLPPSSVIGTSSVRRTALLKHFCPDLQVAELRGNLTTRMNKWRRGDYQAIVLAEAGLGRLGDTTPRFALDPAEWVPPAGQGAIALVCRDDDQSMNALSGLDHALTRRCVDLERNVMKGLGASCQVPIGVWASPGPDGLLLRCLWLSADGSWAKRFERVIKDPKATGALVEDIRRQWRWEG
jgi:hydroxymethylbilane synthase